MFGGDQESTGNDLYFAASQGDVSLVRELLADGCNPYQPRKDGQTALHIALGEDQKEVVEILLEQYRKDFDLVGDYVTREFQFYNIESFWMNRSILVAATEEQCKAVKRWERNNVIENPLNGVLVLLRHPVEGQHVAVLKCNQITRVELVKLVKSFFDNGLLSWNCTGPEGHCETVMNLIASRGYLEHLETLIGLGVDLDAPGLKKRTPFLAACAVTQNEIVALLLTKYIDRFDLLATDDIGQNGLHHLLQQRNKENFQLMLESFINHRVDRYKESRSDAFNTIFNYHRNKLPFMSVWDYIDGDFWNENLEKICKDLQYNVSYQFENCAVLVNMVRYNKVKQYCMAKIRENEQLVELSTIDGVTVLHALIETNELQLVEYLYNKGLSRMRSIFECDTAFATLNSILHKGYLGMLEFIMEKHNDFFQLNIKKIDLHALQRYNASNFDITFPILERFLPQIEALTRERKAMLDRFYPRSGLPDFNTMLEKLINDFPAGLAEITSAGETLDSYNSFSGVCFLHQAIAQNHLTLTEQLFNSKVDIDWLDEDERHAIHYVKSIEMFQLLVRTYPDGESLVHRKDRNGFTLFHIICMDDSVTDREKLILELVRLGVKIDGRTSNQATALHYLSDVALFQFLTKGVEAEGIAGIDVGMRDAWGNTALHWHLRQQNGVIASTMMRSAESFVSFNDKGESYLAYIVRFDRDAFNNTINPVLEENPEKTEAMFEAELDKSKERASILFVDACCKSNEFCIVRMLQMDLDFNVRSPHGMTGLMFLFSTYEVVDAKIVKQLLDKEVDVNQQYENGQSALLMLVENFTRLKHHGYGADLVRCMIEKGARVDLVDNNGNSALHLAIKRTELDLIEVLVEKGADWWLYNKKGEFPYQQGPTGISFIFACI